MIKNTYKESKKELTVGEPSSKRPEDSKTKKNLLTIKNVPCDQYTDFYWPEE